jgi:hypothetical protein
MRPLFVQRTISAPPPMPKEIYCDPHPMYPMIVASTLRRMCWSTVACPDPETVRKFTISITTPFPPSVIPVDTAPDVLNTGVAGAVRDCVKGPTMVTPALAVTRPLAVIDVTALIAPERESEAPLTTPEAETEAPLTAPEAVKDATLTAPLKTPVEAVTDEVTFRLPDTRAADVTVLVNDPVPHVSADTLLKALAFASTFAVH